MKEKLFAPKLNKSVQERAGESQEALTHGWYRWPSCSKGLEPNWNLDTAVDLIYECIDIDASILFALFIYNFSFATTNNN